MSNDRDDTRDEQKITTFGRKGGGGRPLSSASGSNGPSPGFIAFIVLAVIVVVFIVANGHRTEISFGVWTWETTVRWSIFIAILLGVALDRLLIWGMRRRRDRKAHEAEEQQSE